MSPKSSNLAIIIPTYNEANNIVRLIAKLLKVIPDAYIYVVDDSSPDGTYVSILKCFPKNNKIFVFKRTEKNGRGSAVIYGLKHALKNNNIAYFVEMDADFSHDPVDITHMLKSIKSNDIVIASRYISGSKIINWPLSRRVFSRVSNYWAKIILGIPINDYTNGFRVYSRKSLELISLDSITTKGFIVLSDIAYRQHRLGLKFLEVPSTFVNRKRDKSNLSLYEVFEAMVSVILFRLTNKSDSS